MAKTKLTVKTDVGTFTRTTARTYQYIVVGNQTRFEELERRRLSALAQARKEFVRYSNPEAEMPKTFRSHPVSRAFDIQCHNEWLATGKYAEWAKAEAETIAELEAHGPITADVEQPFGVIGWCGRIDLAHKLAASDYAAKTAREVRIYSVNGDRVWAGIMPKGGRS